jgi:cystathionine beta-lyase/cystathionine gamma-synthase
MSPEDRARSGISDSLIRVSVGIESTEDIIADFKQALEVPEF